MGVPPVQDSVQVSLGQLLPPPWHLASLRALWLLPTGRPVQCQLSLCRVEPCQRWQRRDNDAAN